MVRGEDGYASLSSWRLEASSIRPPVWRAVWRLDWGFSTSFPIFPVVLAVEAFTRSTTFTRSTGSLLKDRIKAVFHVAVSYLSLVEEYFPDRRIPTTGRRCNAGRSLHP